MQKSKSNESYIDSQHPNNLAEMTLLLQQYKRMQEEIQTANSFKKAKLHIAFLFASPFC